MGSANQKKMNYVEAVFYNKIPSSSASQENKINIEKNNMSCVTGIKYTKTTIGNIRKCND